MYNFDASNLSKCQSFKNYPEICSFLNEPVKSGRSKQLQIKKWRTQFDFHNEGHKFIIDKVYDNPPPIVPDARVNNGGSNNHKNMDIYLPYIHRCLVNHLGEYMSMDRILCEVLELFDRNAFKAVQDFNNPNRRDEGLIELSDLGLAPSDPVRFRRWLSNAKEFSKKTIFNALDKLKKDDAISFETSYTFFSKSKRTQYFASVEGFNDFIRETEEWACNKLKETKFDMYGIPYTKRSGKPLMYYIRNNSSLMNDYRRLVIDKCLENKSLNDALQKSVQESYVGVELGSSDCPINSYWKSWRIDEIASTPRINMNNYRKQYIDMIVKHATKEGDKPRKYRHCAFLKTTKKITGIPINMDEEPFPDFESYIDDYIPDI